MGCFYEVFSFIGGVFMGCFYLYLFFIYIYIYLYIIGGDYIIEI